MKTSALVEQNNVKRTQLTPANKEMYEKILMYLRCEISLSDNQTEEVLNDLLDHLLEAQENNVTTEEFFGEDPESFAKDLVTELPREKHNELMKFSGVLVCIALGMYLISNNILEFIIGIFNHQTHEKENLLVLLVGGTLSFMVGTVILGIMIKIFQKDIFKYNSNLYTFLKIYLISMILFILMTAIFYICIKYITIGPYVSLVGIIPSLIGFICLIPPVLYFKKLY